MLIKCFALGHIQANCYIVTDEDTLDCVVIDPGGESNTVMQYIEDNHLKCRYILLTHGHFDHTGGVDGVFKETHAPVVMSKNDLKQNLAQLGYKYNPPKGAIFVKDGDSIKFGSLTMKVIETPGHSEGGLTFLCEDALFTGDTLFKDSCGRTDFPGCSGAELLRSLKKLADLPGDYEVYPGHMESTTLERERNFNFAVRQAIQDAE